MGPSVVQLLLVNKFLVNGKKSLIFTNVIITKEAQESRSQKEDLNSHKVHIDTQVRIRFLNTFTELQFSV